MRRIKSDKYHLSKNVAPEKESPPSKCAHVSPTPSRLGSREVVSETSVDVATSNRDREDSDNPVSDTETEPMGHSSVTSNEEETPVQKIGVIAYTSVFGAARNNGRGYFANPVSDTESVPLDPSPVTAEAEKTPVDKNNSTHTEKDEESAKKRDEAEEKNIRGTTHPFDLTRSISGADNMSIAPTTSSPNGKAAYDTSYDDEHQVVPTYPIISRATWIPSKTPLFYSSRKP